MSFSHLMRALAVVTMLLVLQVSVYAQGVTTSSMQGRITDEAGEALIGANVLAVHVPSGTVFGTATDLDGYYRIPGMRVGGPYRITVSYTGYADVLSEGLSLRLGEAYKGDYVMQEAGVNIETITVTARAGTTGTNAGASTQISSDMIENVPTLGRQLNDYTRLTPQASGNSFAGINNRYNAIYIDGAVNNDVFGLAGSGTNGGQTGAAPFSIDIIDQIQVVLSPYDVTLGGFAGGGINAVTKSGTNDFKGTAYMFTQNEGMVGKTNTTLTDRTGSEPSKVAEFNQLTYGASLGGPIMRDKAFFFVNAEIQDDATPAPFDFGVYGGNSSQAQLEALRNHVINTYGYDPGTFGNVEDQLTGLKLFGKIDWNLTDKHRLTLRHNYTKAENYDRNASNAATINFSNNGVYFPSITNSTALELNSRLNAGMSNNLIVGFTSVRDDRDPIGTDFPYVYIEDGGSNVIRMGSEEFSTANGLDQDILTITDNFKIFKKNHTITIGTHNEFYNIYNLFIRQNYGTYRFSSVDDFIAGAPAEEYDRTYSLVDNLTGDGSAAAADFKAMQLGFYAQDEISLSNRLTLTAGLRFDIPIITTDPSVAANFNSFTLDTIRTQYPIANDVEGGKSPDGQLMISPRVGFNYDFKNASSTVLRGGLGVFTSRIPFVWPGAMFNNNGLTLGGVNETNIAGDITFVPNIQEQYTNPNVRVPSGQVDLFVKDFKYPQVFRGNLALDTRLPGGINASFEGIFTKTLNNVLYTNINSSSDVSFKWTGTPDTRTVYTRRNIDNTYSAVYLVSNTNEGYSYTMTATFAKDFDFGLSANLSYTYGDAEAVNEGTSSQNSSQWRGQYNINGRNNPVLGRSDFALGHRLLAGLTYRLDWNEAKNATTTITLLYEGLQGSPYTYLIGGGNARNINNEQGSTSAYNSLIWVPANASEINLIEKNGLTPAQQWDLLNAFIESDPYLSENRGQYADKNSNWMPYTGFLDLSLRQDFGVKAGGKTHKLQLSWDVFNLANLLNSSWGARYSAPNGFNTYHLYTFEGYEADGTTPRFSFTNDKTGKDALVINDFTSRWRMRLGLRYIFD
ncbi:MAG: carboxypeptidase regulatory-like domain-containing protein [Saprospiraceae bacterium]